MSHAIKAASVKAAMIKEGITNLVVQQTLVESAYVRALAMFHRRHLRQPEKCRSFNEYILGYWNEASPINGNLIMAQYNALEARIANALADLGSLRRIEVEITPLDEEQASIDVTKIPGYPELVNYLVEEANKKLPQFINIFGDDR